MPTHTKPITMNAKRRRQLQAEREVLRKQCFEAGVARARVWVATDATFSVMQRIHDFNVHWQSDEEDEDVCLYCAFTAAAAGKEHASQQNREEVEWILDQGHDVDPSFVLGFLHGVSEAVVELERGQAASN